MSDAIEGRRKFDALVDSMIEEKLKNYPLPQQSWFQKNITMSVVLSFIVIAFAVVQAISITFADVEKHKKVLTEIPKTYVTNQKFNSYQLSQATEKDHTLDKINRLSKDVHELSADVKALVQALNKNEVNALKRNAEIRNLIINLSNK